MGGLVLNAVIALSAIAGFAAWRRRIRRAGREPLASGWEPPADALGAAPLDSWEEARWCLIKTRYRLTARESRYGSRPGRLRRSLGWRRGALGELHRERGGSR